jgi:hypothetical protein
VGWDCLALFGFHSYITQFVADVTLVTKAWTLLKAVKFKNSLSGMKGNYVKLD